LGLPVLNNSASAYAGPLNRAKAMAAVPIRENMFISVLPMIENMVNGKQGRCHSFVLNQLTQPMWSLNAPVVKKSDIAAERAGFLIRVMVRH
jgi:hypothetical protein